ncbi:MAG: hypothetical protein NTX36_15205 [Proteobacteria bacterium]|nr:hypothetical protein [Pseudomonadota bacterium]
MDLEVIQSGNNVSFMLTTMQCLQQYPHRPFISHSVLSARIFLFWFVFLFLIPYFALCDEGVKMKMNVVLPSQADGWKISGQPSEHNPKTVFKYMNGAAELYLAYNMKQLTVARYERHGYPTITAEVFNMGSSEDAYGVFSFERDDPEAGIGQGSEFGGGLLRFWKGHTFVSIYGDSPGADIEAATLNLGRQIAASIVQSGKPPEIISLLPDEHTPFLKKKILFTRSHILMNQRFFVAQKNVLELAKDVEAVLCRYEAGKDKIHFLLVKYPSQIKAESAFLSFKNSYMPEARQKNSVKTENNKWTVAEKYKGYIMIVFDSPDEVLALKLIRNTNEILQREGV